MSHTPGPWWIERDERIATTWERQAPTSAARIFGHSPPFALGEIVGLATTEENARLIAAAPEMLEALKKLASLDCCTGYLVEPSDMETLWDGLDMARAAIAKAEGRTV